MYSILMQKISPCMVKPYPMVLVRLQFCQIFIKDQIEKIDTFVEAFTGSEESSFFKTRYLGFDGATLRNYI